MSTSVQEEPTSPILEAMQVFNDWMPEGLRRDWGQGKPDGRALALAQAVQDLLPEDAQVVLFGSRATGDWRPWSDLDLAVIGSDAGRGSGFALKDQANVLADDLYQWAPDIQLFTMSHADFEGLRTSLPHLAGQVQRWGLTPQGEPLPVMPQDNPWPGTRKYLQSSREHLEMALRNLGSHKSRWALYHAHGALETALKAVLGATRVDFKHLHDLNKLLANVPDSREEWLEGLFTDSQLKELTDFRPLAVYGGSDVDLPSMAAEEIVGKVQYLSGRLAGRALDALRKTPRDVGHAKEEWLGDGPMAGWESVPLDYFLDPAPQLRAEAERALALLGKHVGSQLSGRDRHEIATHWRMHGLPEDMMDCLMTLQGQPDQWRTILDIPAEQSTDTDSTS